MQLISIPAISSREMDLIGDSSSHEIEAGSNDCSPRDA